MNVSANVMAAKVEARLWHEMRQDLASFVPELLAGRLLMCCACGRFLPQEDFNLEHLIPRQALKLDPVAVRQDPDTPANVRAGILLLCKKPLKYRGSLLYANGCNSWKGKFYDGAISEMVHGKAFRFDRSTQPHIIAALCLGYLAMVAEFGYRVALVQSGLLMREQFFNPRQFRPAVPLTSQMLMGNSEPITNPKAPMWAKPFAFSFREGACIVTMRSFCIVVPVSRDPRQPIAKHLRITPQRYKLRPDLRTAFD